MTSQNPNPSPRTAGIVQADSSRRDLLEFNVTAKIHRDDVEQMAARVDTAIDRLGAVDILLIFATFEGATLGAIFDGKATQVSLRSAAHVRRYGVVGAPGFADAMIKMFDPVSPVDAKTFDIAELEDARRWIDGDATR